MTKLEKEVDLVAEAIINYKNTNRLNWNGAYREILRSLDMEDRYDDMKLIQGVVKKISWAGYEMIYDPFRLKRFQ